MQQNFSAANPNFWARLLIFFFSVVAMLGVQFPQAPEALTGNILNTLSSGGTYAVIGVLVVSVIMPIVNLVRTKPKINVYTLIGSTNFWIYAASFVFGILVLFGIQVPDGTAEAMVSAAWVKDWGSLFSIALTNLLDPIIRAFIDKKKATLAPQTTP